MNKEETIEFIKKYKDCLYYSKSFFPENLILLTAVIDKFEKLNQINSVIWKTNKDEKYYKLTVEYYKKNSRITHLLTYTIDMNKKNIIDRKSKIQSIVS